MKGRTKSFFEDVLVLLLVLGLFIGLYYFFFGAEKKVPDAKREVETIKEVQKIPPKEPEHLNTLEENLTKVQSPIENNISKGDNNKTVDTKISRLEEKNEKDLNSTSKKVDPNRIAHLIKNVDLKLLKQFKVDVKRSIQEKIKLDETKSKQDQNFSMRVTVLKDGSYEQLVFTGGNKEIYEKNTDNIVKVFPLVIDPKIEQDFPRYLRFSFQFQ